MHSHKILLLILCTLQLLRCVPPDEQPITKVSIDVNKPEWQQVNALVDAREFDSLYQYINSPDPTYRYMVAKGLAYDSTVDGADSLVTLLADPIMEVRSMAATALGLRGESSAAGKLIAAFRSKDTLNVDNQFNGAILEAVGRTGGENLLQSIATVSTYRTTDTLLLLGQARAIYRYALRGITLPQGTDKMVQFVTEPNIPPAVRLVAANYLHRAKDVQVAEYKYRIGEVFTTDPNPHIRMALASVLGRTADQEVLALLTDRIANDDDYRVRLNSIRALSSYPYINVVEPILQLLGDDNSQIAEVAADYLIKYGNKNDAVIYRNFINDTLSATVNAKLYSAVLKHIPVFYTNTKSVIKQDLLEKYDAASSLYVKADYLRALGYDPYNHKVIADLLADCTEPILKTAGMEALGTVLGSENFQRAHRGRSRLVRKDILTVIKREIGVGDVGALAVAGGILANPEMNIKELVDSTQYIVAAAEKLTLPRETETYNSLQTAFAYLTDTKYQAVPPVYNNPVDYSVLSTYGDSARVAIKLESGVVRVEMYTHEAPATVANFLELVTQGFYDGKVFHRVVPNFVVQAGCPRGDGYGSLDYTIRTEATESYYDREGYIGMASAGNDTEGTQWFITHSPAMHLDGRYTIFGKVTEGMELIHNVRQGDVIQDIIITKN